MVRGLLPDLAGDTAGGLVAASDVAGDAVAVEVEADGSARTSGRGSRTQRPELEVWMEKQMTFTEGGETKCRLEMELDLQVSDR